MSVDIERWDPPNDPAAFESLCLDLWQEICEGHAQKNGRSGQPQAGVDIFGQQQGKWIGVQCKQKDGLLRHRVTHNELAKEVAAALEFTPPLSKFVLATTGPRDAGIQELARVLTTQHRGRGLFEVEVWCWDDIWIELYRREPLFKLIASNYWPRAASLANTKGILDKRRVMLCNLPFVESTLIGREEELAFLDNAWANPVTNFVQIIASGGTGKTALVDRWFRRHLIEAAIFVWSFFSQGTSARRQTSSDPFFAEILSWLHIKLSPTASIYAMAEAVASRLREDRVLLILDGVEPLQDATGNIRDVALKALLQELDTENRGLVVCTTRFRMDIPDDPPRALHLDLGNLTPDQGAEYLRCLKTEGPDEELPKASREYGGHALALTLLGSFLADFHDHDIHRRFEIRQLLTEEGKQYEHARRMIAAYERVFLGTPEGTILQALGYFDRPAEVGALQLVLPAMEERTFRRALKRLYEARLVLTIDPSQPVDCHPLLREHFALGTTEEGHGRLCDHYKKQAPNSPDTVEEMVPIQYAIYHGCLASRHAECLNDIYKSRILRGEEFYLNRVLGENGTDISLLANFFDVPWSRPVAGLSPADQSWVASKVGFVLRSIGRLNDAEGPMRYAADAAIESEDWEGAARRHGSLSELYLALGAVPKAVTAARQSVDFADRSLDWLQKVKRYTDLADCLSQSGDRVEPRWFFIEAERLQSSHRPSHPILYSLPGYRSCDFLLALGESAEVIRRASQTLRWAEAEGSLLDIGLDHISLGRAHPGGSGEATFHLDHAVDYLRRAGTVDNLPLALLARGTRYDLTQVFRTATRCGMRLYLVDYHLNSAGLDLAGGDQVQASEHLEKAETLITETGYHCRDLELTRLRAALGRLNSGVGRF